nr:S24/S26 family peptidase [Lachnospiraceae bacterium]
MKTNEYLDILKEQVSIGKEASMIITGNSLAPFLYHGSDVIYFSKPKAPPQRGDMVFFNRPNGQYVMHRLIKKKGEDCYFLGDNQTDIEGPLPEKCIFAVVTRV